MPAPRIAVDCSGDLVRGVSAVHPAEDGGIEGLHAEGDSVHACSTPGGRGGEV